MQCTISSNPSIPAENAFCQQAPERWTAAAWALGRRLLKGPMRTRAGWAGSRGGLIDDLRVRGLVEIRGAGWIRITEQGRAQFPSQACWEYPPETPDCHGSHEWGRLAVCDARPDPWKMSAPDVFRRACDVQPKREPRPSRRVPEQIVRSDRGLLPGASFDPELKIPPLADTIRRAPADDFARGDVDMWPATRIGYPTGPSIKRNYA